MMFFLQLRQQHRQQQDPQQQPQQQLVRYRILLSEFLGEFINFFFTVRDTNCSAKTFKSAILFEILFSPFHVPGV